MKFLLFAAAFVPGLHTEAPLPAPNATEERPMTAMIELMDFSQPDDEPAWVAVNDDVMGGVSQGAPRIAGGQLQFEGALSLANNGGFASIRARSTRFALSASSRMVLRVKGDGRRYQLRLATDARFRGSPVSFGAEFGTEAGQWSVVTIRFDELQPTWRGNRLDGPAFDPERVEEIGLLIGDGREGPFRLAVDWIRAE